MGTAPRAVARPRARRSEGCPPEPLERALRALEQFGGAQADPATELGETVGALWRIVEQATSESSLDVSRQGVRATLGRREVVRRATCILSAVIRRGVESGAFRPACVSWAVERLPFAIVAGACVHWVFGLSPRPALQAGTAVEAALELLRP